LNKDGGWQRAKECKLEQRAREDAGENLLDERRSRLRSSGSGSWSGSGSGQPPLVRPRPVSEEV